MIILKKLIYHLKRPDAWVYPGYINLKTRYARTALGPWWETLATTIFISFAGFLWSRIFNMDIKTFLPHLFSGMIIWKFYSQIILTSAISYHENSALIKSIKHEYIVHNLKGVFRDVLIFMHNVPLCLFIIFWWA